MPKTTINNASIYYELHGEGEPLVLISGLKGDHSGWLPVLDGLTNQYQVLIFDNRGVGRTVDDGKPFTVDTMADDAFGLIEALELRKPHIVGHSLGGAIAQVIANKYGNHISSVTLCNTFSELNKVARDVFTKTLKLYQDKATPAEIMDSIIPWVFSEKFVTPQLIDIIRSVSNADPFWQTASDYERQLDALYSFNSSSWINGISVPTLVLGAEHDPVATVEESKNIAGNISGSVFMEIATGHASQVEDPQNVLRILSDFLAKNPICVRNFKCA